MLNGVELCLLFINQLATDCFIVGAGGGNRTFSYINSSLKYLNKIFYFVGLHSQHIIISTLAAF